MLHESFRHRGEVLQFVEKLKPPPKLAAGGKPSTWFPPGGLVEHIWCSLRVIRRQGRASLKIPKLRHLGDLGVPKLMNLEIYEKVWLYIIFYARICYFNLE